MAQHPGPSEKGLKDMRRIAIRYDKLTQNFIAAVCLAAIIIYWL